MLEGEIDKALRAYARVQEAVGALDQVADLRISEHLLIPLRRAWVAAQSAEEMLRRQLKIWGRGETTVVRRREIQPRKRIAAVG